jgi:hypothetical protein
MSDDPNKHWSDAEANALRSLAAGSEASPGLEDRIVTELKRRGAIRVNGGWIMKISKTAAALIIVAATFATGFVAGKRAETAPASAPVVADANTDGQYMLLMFTRVDPARAQSGTETAGTPEYSDAYKAIIEEYRQWAIAREQEGRLVSAEKLADATRVMTGTGERLAVATHSATDRILGGYFLITAPTLEDAVALAKTHPHLKYGGEVEVRPVEKTN